MSDGSIIQKLKSSIETAAHIHRIAELGSNFHQEVLNTAVKTKDRALFKAAKQFEESFSDSIFDLNDQVNERSV